MKSGLVRSVSKYALDNEQELILKVPWGKLTALCWGDPSDPPVLLCHGRQDTCSSFRPLIPGLPPKRFYVSMELPGNGQSDHYPRNGALHITDFLPPTVAIRDYFKWKKYEFVGHSMGTSIGKYMDYLWPGQVTKLVEIDPEPTYFGGMRNLNRWYEYYYVDKFYGSETHRKMNAGPETAPKYKYELVRDRVMKARNLPEDIIKHILERYLEPAGDGLYRITYDQRLKHALVYHPLLYDYMQKFYTDTKTPILGIFASDSIARGCYKEFSFALDASAWKNNKYQVVILEGQHDIHLQHVEKVSKLISDFLESDPQ